MRPPNPPVKPSKLPTADKAEPKEEEGSNLWLLLSQTPRPSRKVPFPRKLPGTDESVGEVAIWPLTHGELLDANAAADQRVKSLFKDKQDKDELNLGYNHSFANELAVQQLWRACRDPDDLLKPAFPSPKMMSLKFTGDEIGVLYNHYLTVQTELGPIVSRMSDDEYESWVRRIAESGSADPTASLSPDLLTTLVKCMASHLVDFWTLNSSSGSPQDENTSKLSTESETSGRDSDVS